MSDGDGAFWVMLAVVVLGGVFSLGAMGGAAIEEATWQSELIDRGHAQYNETTGDWEWKNEQ